MARTDPASSNAYSTPPPLAARTSSAVVSLRALKVSVAPSLLANSSLSSARSIATTRDAPAATAPMSDASPTPPRPMTATLAPAGTFAVLTTAPTPVSTAQPNSAAWSSGSSGSILTIDRRDTVAYSANADTPRWWLTGSPLRFSRFAPESSVPLVLAAAPGSQSAGRPSEQGSQWPQLGTNTMTTWSPFFRSSTPGPISSTMPAASWPSAIGVGRGRSPLITDRSEWQRPAAAIFTSTSPWPGPSRSISSIESGRDLAYGDVAPIAFRTAARIFIADSPVLQRRFQVLQPLGELHVLRVVDRAVDDRDRVVGERALERRQEVGGFLDAVALRTEALGVLHEVGVLERDVARPPEVAELVPGDQPVLGVVPDQDHDRRLLPDRGLDLLRVHHEPGITGHGDDLAVRVRELRGHRARDADPHRGKAVGDDAGIRLLGLVHARHPHLVRADVGDDDV